MISDEEEKKIVDSIQYHRKEIFELIESLYKNDEEFLTKYCENMECDKCKIGRELAIVQAINCWTTSKQFKK